MAGYGSALTMGRSPGELRLFSNSLGLGLKVSFSFVMVSLETR